MDEAKEKLIKDLEKEAKKLHGSTRTYVTFLSPVHNYLRSKSRIYYSWSINSKASAIHLAAILAFLISLVIFAFLKIII